MYSAHIKKTASLVSEHFKIYNFNLYFWEAAKSIWYKCVDFFILKPSDFRETVWCIKLSEDCAMQEYVHE